MKKIKFVVLFTFVLWLVVLCIPSWAATKYLGESTWIITITMRENGIVTENMSGTVKMAVTQMGGNYVTVQGYLELPDDGPVILSGGGALINDTVHLTVIASQKHTDNNRDTEVMNIQLNKTTLNGTFYSVGNDFDVSTAGNSPEFDTRFSSGTLTLSGSPIIFAANTIVPLTTLLLEE